MPPAPPFPGLSAGTPLVFDRHKVGAGERTYTDRCDTDLAPAEMAFRVPDLQLSLPGLSGGLLEPGGEWKVHKQDCRSRDQPPLGDVIE